MMFDYIVRKVLYGILVLWGVATIVFFLFTIVPGDPVRMMLGQRADEKDVIAIREELGLNQSVAKQYVNYLNDLSLLSVYDAEKQPCKCLRIASFGEKSLVVKPPYLRFSYQSKRQVADILTEAFPNTLILASVSIFFAMLFGITLGVLAAVLNSNFINRLTLFVTTLGMSLPSFFAAILIAWLFGYVLESVTGLGMTGSLFSVDDYGNGSYLDLKNLILPALTLGIR
ncbi:MAG: ABC transporter permease, partial [Bacteroidales bacterium]|nr:ABC transporter permease [Bacteroidales bacterium]